MNNMIAETERIAWEQLKAFSGGGIRAEYKQGDRSEAVDVVPSTPTAGRITFGGFPLYDNSQVFEMGVADLKGIVPKDGDTLTVNGTVHKVCKAMDGPSWLPVGSYGVTIQIHTRTYRS